VKAPEAPSSALPPGRDDPDASAVAAARRGDGPAFDLLVRRHEGRILRLACRLVGDSDAALDAAQETFVRAWRGLPRFEGASRFSTWITRIAINQCRNELRRRRTLKHARPLSLEDRVAGSELTRGETIEDRGPQASDVARASEVARAFEAALGAIDADDREVLVLREVEDLSYEAISEVLDVAVGTVRSRLHRARAALRGRMGEVLG
jgi:RNA polymerase sigma-70 factor (ECF subfamily)